MRSSSLSGLEETLFFLALDGRVNFGGSGVSLFSADAFPDTEEEDDGGGDDDDDECFFSSRDTALLSTTEKDLLSTFPGSGVFPPSTAGDIFRVSAAVGPPAAADG